MSDVNSTENAERTLGRSSPGLRAPPKEEAFGTGSKPRKPRGKPKSGLAMGVVTFRAPTGEISKLREGAARAGVDFGTYVRGVLGSETRAPGRQPPLPLTSRGPAPFREAMGELTGEEAEGYARAELRAAKKEIERLTRELAGVDQVIERRVAKELHEEAAKVQSQNDRVVTSGAARAARIEGRVVVATIELPRPKGPPADGRKRGWVPMILPTGNAGKGVEVTREGPNSPWLAVDDGRDMTEAAAELGVCSTPDTAKARALGKVVISRW